MTKPLRVDDEALAVLRELVDDPSYRVQRLANYWMTFIDKGDSIGLP